MWSSSSSHSVWTDIVCRHHCIRLESFYRTFWFYLYFFIHFLSRLSNTKLSDTMNDDKNNKTNVKKKKRKKCFAIVTRRPFRHAQNPTAATHTQYRSGQVRIVWMRRGVVCSNVTNKKQSKIIVPNVLTTRVCRQLTNTDPTKIITTINMNVVGVDETQTTEKREKSFRSVFFVSFYFSGARTIVSSHSQSVWTACVCFVFIITVKMAQKRSNMREPLGTNTNATSAPQSRTDRNVLCSSWRTWRAPVDGFSLALIYKMIQMSHCHCESKTNALRGDMEDTHTHTPGSRRHSTAVPTILLSLAMQMSARIAHEKLMLNTIFTGSWCRVTHRFNCTISCFFHAARWVEQSLARN